MMMPSDVILYSCSKCRTCASFTKDRMIPFTVELYLKMKIVKRSRIFNGIREINSYIVRGYSRHSLNLILLPSSPEKNESLGLKHFHC